MKSRHVHLVLVFLCWLAPAVASGAGAAGVVLSTQGSGRATAYPPTNKVVTLDGRTHVTWLDSDEEGFWVRIRTLERRTGERSPVTTIGAAQDNHGGAALTVDAEGYLHVLYYPHHAPMRYRRSLRPNDASAWSAEEQFGEALTYPVVMTAPDGTLLMTARRSYDEKLGYTPPEGSLPWEAELWRRPPGGPWTRVGPVLQSRFPGYAQFAEAFWWGEEGRVLHLACRIYETDYHGTRELFTTVGYLQSRDQGLTWQRSDGTPVALPATSQTLEVIATGGTQQQSVLTAGGLMVAGDGQPRILYAEMGPQGARTWLAAAQPGGGWQTTDLSREMTGPWREGELVIPGAITRTRTGRWLVVATWQRVPAGESWWGHVSNEVVQLWSDDEGRSWTFSAISEPDPARPRWLPNVERATGHHDVPAHPGITYTDGEAGATNAAVLSNRVRWVEGAHAAPPPPR